LGARFPDLLIAETALRHGLGVLHIDGDYERIAEVRPLVLRRLG
jgi:predicted nucleic acid-binding protein